MTGISVITINLNNRAGLEKTMDSVASQHRDEFQLEFLVIDGRSTDGSVDLVQSRRGEVDVFVSEPDGGVYSAMNKGLNLATREWAVFMNSGDCFASPTALAEMLNSARSQTEPPWLIYGDNISPRGLEPAGPLYMLRAGIIHACHQAMAFRVCDLRYNEKYRIYSDLDFVLQYYKRFKAKAFHYVPKALSSIEASGISASFPMEKRREKFRIVYDRMGAVGLLFALSVSVLTAIDLL